MSRLTYAELAAPPADHWIHERMPEWMVGSGPLGLLWWQWAALAALVPISIAAGALLGRLARFILGRVAKRTSARWDDALVDVIMPPLRWVLSLLAFRALLEGIALDTSARANAGTAMRALVFLCLFWTVFRGLDRVQRSATAGEWAKERPAARSLMPIAMRVSKVVVTIIAVISLLSYLGYPVAGLIAGLGIGGIAIALAGQKTVENLFGAFTIGIDQPFREGDFVNVDGVLGNIEAIGLRSTRVRTLDRTVVSIPNAQMAEARVETFAERDRIRLRIVIGVVYETTGAQLETILEGIRKVLNAHPRVRREEKDDVQVRFMGFGASSLDIEVIAYFLTTEFSEFRILREEALLDFIRVVEGAGSSFAFPSQSVYVKELPARARA